MTGEPLFDLEQGTTSEDDLGGERRFFSGERSGQVEQRHDLLASVSFDVHVVETTSPGVEAKPHHRRAVPAHRNGGGHFEDG
jgi:hypothetical protein